MSAAPPRTHAALFAGAAYDPSAAPGGLVAWQRPTGVALLACAAAPPGCRAATRRVGPARVAWRDGDRLVVAEPATLAPVAAYDAPGAGAVALSRAGLAWRARDADGRTACWVRSPAGRRPRAVAGAAAPRELGRPALAGDLAPLPHGRPGAAAGSSRSTWPAAAAGAPARARARMLTNPPRDGAAAALRARHGRAPAAAVGPLAPARARADDTAILSTPVARPARPGARAGRKRTATHEPPLPPLRRAPRASPTRSGRTALTADPRLRHPAAHEPQGAPRTADILRVPARRAAG